MIHLICYCCRALGSMDISTYEILCVQCIMEAMAVKTAQIHTNRHCIASNREDERKILNKKKIPCIRAMPRICFHYLAPTLHFPWSTHVEHICRMWVSRYNPPNIWKKLEKLNVPVSDTSISDTHLRVQITYSTLSHEIQISTSQKSRKGNQNDFH